MIDTPSLACISTIDPWGSPCSGVESSKSIVTTSFVGLKETSNDKSAKSVPGLTETELGNATEPRYKHAHQNNAMQC